MKRAFLIAAVMSALAAVTTPAHAGPFKLYATTYNPLTFNEYTDPNFRGAKCTNELTFYGVIQKAATPGYPYDVQYRWVTQDGPQAMQEIALGIIETDASAVELHMPVSGPLNARRTFTAQLEMVKPYKLLSNKVTIRWSCKPTKPSQKVPTTPWPTN
jgi:hypothetical protein